MSSPSRTACGAREPGFLSIPTFLRITESDYQAGFQFVDFGNDAEGTRKRINTWVEDKTNKKIEDLFPKGVIKNNTRLVLVNAIYFNAEMVRAISNGGD